MNFHHIGIATRDLLKIRQDYLDLGYSAETEVISDPKIGINCQFLIHPSAPRIELVEQLENSNVLDPWLRSGSPMYHMAFMVEAFAPARVSKSMKVFDLCPAVAFQGQNVSFHLRKDRFLIELIHVRSTSEIK
jgi:methylmalonyl-CoA/ethylmalonyl-CoA epimerase